jgi:hypothetical protein
MSKTILEKPTSEGGSQANAISPANRPLPSVEIFASQLPINIHQGNTKSINLTGAVYDQPFVGTITLRPSPDFTTGCPLFANVPFNGNYAGVFFPVGPNSVSLPFSVTGPTGLTPGKTYTCTLTYDAEFTDNFGNKFAVGKGNKVTISYNLKKKLLPGEQDT